MSIDFSKAPEGATHYIDVYGGILFYKKIDGRWFCHFDKNGWGPSPNADNQMNYVKFKSIPTQLFGQYTPETDRERMLCDAVIMKCRGIDVERYIHKEWTASTDKKVCVQYKYRRAPKLPEIPWEWIDECVEKIAINSAGEIQAITRNSSSSGLYCLKLDLTDVELPVTVNRPGGVM